MTQNNTEELVWGQPVAKTDKTNDFGKLELGQNKIRVLSNALPVFTHFTKDATGKQRGINCANAGCPLCTNGEKLGKSYLVTILDRHDGVVKILRAPTTVITAINAIAADVDFGSPTGYDVTITRTGNGLNTKYSVIPSPHKPLSAAEKDALVAFRDRVDMAKFAKPETVESMNKKLGFGDPNGGWSF